MHESRQNIISLQNFKEPHASRKNRKGLNDWSDEKTKIEPKNEKNRVDKTEPKVSNWTLPTFWNTNVRVWPMPKSESKRSDWLLEDLGNWGQHQPLLLRGCLRWKIIGGGKSSFVQGWRLPISDGVSLNTKFFNDFQKVCEFIKF